MRRPLRSALVGIGLIVLGIGAFSAIHQWIRTRIAYPLDMPVSLARGHIRTRPFRLNLRTRYLVSISPGADWHWDQAHPECSPYRHLQSRWVLYRDGKAVDRLDEPVTLPWPSWFIAGSGEYQLDLEVMTDLSCVDPAGPHLEIIADTEPYEVAGYLLKDLCLLIAYIGVVMLAFVPLVRVVGSLERSYPLTASPTAIGQNYQWAQRLPLRRRISGLPSFGLFAGIFFALIAMVTMFSSIPLIPKGLWVHVLKPGAGPVAPDQWNKPLIVMLRDGGPYKDPEPYLDGKRVPWDDLAAVLRQELSRRREWTVYVGGDDCVSWANFATVIDSARGLGAKVVLTGEDSRPCEWLGVLPRRR